MTGTKPTTRIAELPVRWLRDHMHEALIIYGLAMGYDSAGSPVSAADRGPSPTSAGAPSVSRSSSS